MRLPNCSNSVKFLLTASVVLFLQTAADALPAKRLVAQSGQQPQQSAGQSFIDIFTQPVQARLGLRVAADAAGIVHVVKVKDGSPAAQAGLKASDEIKDARRVGHQVVVIYLRDGKSNAATLDEQAADMVPQLPVLDSAYQPPSQPGQPFTLGVQKIGSAVEADENPGTLRLLRPMTAQIDHPVINLNAKQLAAFANYPAHAPLSGNLQERVRVIAKYSIELFVDQSGSMHFTDCPNRVSRWAWCGMQAEDMATRLTPFVPQGLNITTFAGTYSVYENALPQTIAQIFKTGKLQLYTRPAEPLNDRISKYLAARKPGCKPLLIAIITDGAPTPPPAAENTIKAIVSATQNMTYPGEITIVIFRIGNQSDGLVFLRGLPQALQAQGARYNIVRIVDFNRLIQIGLAEALVEAIEGYEQ